MSDLKPIFEIKKMFCSYEGTNKRVLLVEDLEIPRGKIVAVLGSSGIGKSTFLESLGLMNNTLEKESQVVFNPVNEKVTYEHLWEVNSREKVSKIRRDYFSFIFQSTNLMDNFSAYENACLTAMIQGSSYTTSLEKSKNYFEQLGLGGIELSQRAFELSGGQKQRLAFARAIMPDFEVLFADEPTGNLDEHSANNLMNILSAKIKEKNKTAIIVTHSIELAMNFAENILIISPSEKGSYGELKPSHNFTRDSGSEGNHVSDEWTNSRGARFDSQVVEEQIRAIIS